MQVIHSVDLRKNQTQGVSNRMRFAQKNATLIHRIKAVDFLCPLCFLWPKICLFHRPITRLFSFLRALDLEIQTIFATKGTKGTKINNPDPSLLLAPLPGYNLCGHLSGGVASLSHRLHAATPPVSKCQSLRAKFWGSDVLK